MRNFGCSGACHNCGTDENGNITEDRCPNCNERSKGEKVCMSCENNATWAEHIAENGVAVTCQTCAKTWRTDGDWVKFCSVECAMAKGV